MRMTLNLLALLLILVGLGLGLMGAGRAGSTTSELSLICKVHLGAPVDSSPALGEWPMFRHDPQHTGFAGTPADTVYIGSNDLSLHAIELRSCEERWQFFTSGMVKASPAIAVNEAGEEVIYIGADDGNLYALNQEGQKLWQFQPELLGIDGLPPPGALRSSPAIGPDGTIYVGSDDGHLYAIAPDGQERWRFLPRATQQGGGEQEQYIGPVRASPVIDPQTQTLYIGSLDRRLYALDLEGGLKWWFMLDGPIRSSPAIGPDGTIYAVSDIGTLYALRPDMVEKWRLRLGGDVLASPAIGPDGTIYLGADDGILYAIRPNGTIRCRYPTQGTIRSSPAISPEGTIFVGSEDGNLYALSGQTCEPQGKMFSTKGPIRSSPTLVQDRGRLLILFGSRDGSFYVVSFP